MNATSYFQSEDGAFVLRVCGAVKGEHWNNLDGKCVGLELFIITFVKPYRPGPYFLYLRFLLTCKFSIFISKTGKKRNTFGKFGWLSRNTVN